MTRLKKIFLTIVFAVGLSTAGMQAPEAVKYIRENHMEHPNSNIAMIMSGSGHGTGFFISSNILATNAHVVGNKTEVTVQLSDNSLISGNVVAKDKLHDLAFIKVGISKGDVLALDLTHLKRGDSVMTIGFGKNTWYSARYGKVLYHYLLNIPRIGVNAMYVRANLGVMPGHSGSPVFNSEGKVVGIISLGGGGESMFIPAHYIDTFYKQYLTFLQKMGILEIEEIRKANEKTIKERG